MSAVATCKKMCKKLLRGRRANERGATLVFTAISMVLLLWAGASGVDVGFSVYGSRQAQATADTAALDLARYLSYADTLGASGGITAVQNYLDTKKNTVLTDNGSNASLTVVPGYYASGTFTKSGPSGNCAPTKFPPILPGCNAIEVTASQSVPQIFFGGFNVLKGHAGNTISTSVSGSSIGANTPEAGFSIGTYLINASTQQSPMLNVLLGQLGTASVTAVGYEGLATTYVTLGQLITASGGALSANNVLTTSLSAQQWQSIWQTATANQVTLLGLNCSATPTPTTCAAKTALSSTYLTLTPSKSVELCQLLTVNFNNTNYGCGSGPIPTQGLNASVNVLQSLTAEAELANGSSGVNLNVAGMLGGSDGLLNFGSVNLSLQMIQPAQVAYGPVGTTATTAQVKSTLSVGLSTLGINLGTLSIPLSAASGTATLHSVTCVDNSMLNTQINGTTQALSTTVTLTLGALVTNAATMTVTGANSSATYTQSVVPPTVATATATPNPTNPVNIGTTAPTAVLTFGGVAGGLNSLVSGLLSPTSSVLAEAYGPVLQGLGVTVAGAQIADLSTNCGAVSLVQ